MEKIRSTPKSVWRFLLSAAVFLAATMPFRYWCSLINVTEIRPAAALPPFFGMVFGVPGILGCAVSNLAADLLSGYSPAMSFASFPVQCLMGLLPWVLWYRIPERDGKKAGFPQMDSTAHVIKYLLIILVNSLVITLLLGVILQVFGIAMAFSQVTQVMFWNNLDFGVMLGLPLLTLAAHVRGHRFSMNERLILIFLLLATLCAVLTGIAVWGYARMMTYSRVQLWNRVYYDMALTLNVTVAAELLFLIYMERRITIPIQRLAALTGGYVQTGAETLDSERLIKACEPYAADETEVGGLARSYIRMISDLDTYMENLKAITTEKERMETELNIAARIQADMLPSPKLLLREQGQFNISAMMIPAKEVGGDFYDFFMIDADHLALVMADVSGKGVPAALFMVVAKTLMKNRAQMGDSPAQVLANVNEQLCEGNEAELFVTVWLAILELSTGKGIAANAGHEHPVLRRADGSFALVRYRHSPAVATMEGLRFREHTFELHPGDSLYVYTDGVPEATNGAGEMFGTERMVGALNENPDAEPALLLRTVMDAIDGFIGDAPQFDDITMLGLKYLGRDGGEGGTKNAGDED